jgi:hypothetical protein
MVAVDVEQLHGDNNLSKETSLDDNGETVNGRGDSLNRHDILTGSMASGISFAGETNLTCQNWTSSGSGSAQLGHHDRDGGGTDPTSWGTAKDPRTF